MKNRIDCDCPVCFGLQMADDIAHLQSKNVYLKLFPRRWILNSPFGMVETDIFVTTFHNRLQEIDMIRKLCN